MDEVSIVCVDLAKQVFQAHGTTAARSLRKGKLLSDPASNCWTRFREARCLRWIAEGKSMEIAAQLKGISYDGARFFLRSAKATLGAVNH